MEGDIDPLQAQFHQSFGYYAQGVGPEAAILPKDWMQPVHRVQSNDTNGRVGYCLDVLDLFLEEFRLGAKRRLAESSPQYYSVRSNCRCGEPWLSIRHRPEAAPRAC